MKKIFCLFAALSLGGIGTVSSREHDVPAHPPLLKKKDRIAIVAPASKVKESKKVMEKATEIFQSWGLEVVLGKYVSVDSCNAFAGSDAQRAEDMQWALDDPTIKAVISLRGGYGTTRIVDQLDFTHFLKNPKWVIGFSDITALHIRLHNLGFVSAHGAVPILFSNPQHKASIDSLRTLLFEGTAHLTAPANALNRLGVVTAPVVGGNLGLICNNMETLSALDTKNKILVIEEVGEHLYALDRMMVQLKRAGKLKDLAGLVVGKMVYMQDISSLPMNKSAEGIIQEHVAGYNYPVAFQFSIGHEAPNLAFPHGEIGTLCVESDKASLVFRK
ncbi:MAG: LD-carboxypeptidase [Amoebophilaceae bacterium]|jgi:muramoyltetrapeptide carboxypeptidase|nr:LD-carboxypeptidase [Amoebophilaceae bacterium]